MSIFGHSLRLMNCNEDMKALHNSKRQLFTLQNSFQLSLHLSKKESFTFSDILLDYAYSQGRKPRFLKTYRSGKNLMAVVPWRLNYRILKGVSFLPLRNRSQIPKTCPSLCTVAMERNLNYTKLSARCLINKQIKQAV